MTKYNKAREIRNSEIMQEYWRKKKYQEADKKQRFEEGDVLEFTGKEYNLAKIYNYEDKFKNKELIVEHVLRCPCGHNRNDNIKFKGIERILPFCFF